MSKPLDTHFFNPAAPLDSITAFTNKHQLLPLSERKRFYTDLQSFFAKNAFKNEPLKIHSEERLEKIDLPCLFHSMRLDDCADAYQQLLLNNISKVTGHIFSNSLDAGNASYKVCMTHNSSLRDQVFWGWIPKRYVDAPSRLERWLDKSEAIVHLNKQKPSTLVALQRLQYFKNRSDDVDISLETLLDLYYFAKDFDIPPLKKDLLELFRSLRLNDADISELKEMQNIFQADLLSDDSEEFDAWEALNNTGVRNLTPSFGRNLWREFMFNSYGKDSPSKKEPQANEARYHVSTRSLVHHHDENRPSEWFDPESPYSSIARFTDRCCTLPPEELPRFLSTVDNFFSQAAVHELKIEVPEEMKERFTHIDLPFLLATQTSSTSERRRFIATVQMVTGLAIELKKRDQLHLVQNVYGPEGLPANSRTTWIPVQEARILEQNASAGEASRSSATHTNPLLRTPHPFFPIVDEKSLQFESSEQLISLLCLALDSKNDSWVKKICLALRSASRTPAKWSECSQLLAAHLGREDVCQALERYAVPSLKPDIAKLDSNQLWGHFAYQAGQHLENRDRVRDCFLKLARKHQLKALQYADSLSLTTRDPCSLEDPDELVEKLCLAHDLSLQSYEQRAWEVIRNAAGGDQWRPLSKELGGVLDRLDILRTLNDIPPLDYGQLTSGQLWRLFSYRYGEDRADGLRDKLMELTHSGQEKALLYAEQWTGRSRFSDQPEELVDVLCLALDLSLMPIVQETCEKIRSLENNDKWAELSYEIAFQLGREDLFTALLQEKIPLLKPKMNSLPEDLGYNVFRFNLQQYGDRPEDVCQVIDSTFGDSKDRMRSILVRFKEEATPSQLGVINSYLFKIVIESIPPETEDAVRECSGAILRELAQPDFPLSAANVAACVRRQAEPHRTKNLQRNIYKLLIADCTFPHVQNALQEAYTTSFVADGLDDVFEPDSVEEEVRSQFNELIEVLCEDSSSTVEDRLEAFKRRHFLSDEDKLQLAKFWQAQGVSIAHKGRTLSKQQVWEALCTVYHVDLPFLLDYIETHFSGSENAKEFLLEIGKRDFDKYYCFYSDDHKIEAKEAKVILDFFAHHMPNNLTVSTELQKYLSLLSAHMLALYIPSMPEHEDKDLKWMSSFLVAMAQNEDEHIKICYSLSDDEILKARDILQQVLDSWNNSFAQGIRQNFWNRFCDIYHADLLLMLRDIDVKANSKTFLESALKELEGNDPQDDREIVVKHLEENQIELEEVANLSRQVNAYLEKLPSGLRAFSTDRIARICRRLIDSLNIWIEQENKIQEFLTHLPPEGQTKNVQLAFTHVMRRTFRTTKPKQFAVCPLTEEATLATAKILRSQDVSLECRGKKITSSEVWEGFCEAHRGDALLLRETVLQRYFEDEQIQDVLSRALQKYQSQREENNDKIIGKLCKNLSPEQMNLLAGQLGFLSRTTTFASKPLKEFLINAAAHVFFLMEIEKLRTELGESNDLWFLISKLFSKKYMYLFSSMPSKAYCGISWKPIFPMRSTSKSVEEEKQMAIDFFQKALATEDISPRTYLLEVFWGILCSKEHLDVFSIQPKIEAQFAERPDLQTLLFKACERDSVEVPSIEEKDVASIEAFLAREVQNNRMVSDEVKGRVKEFPKKLWELVQKEKVSRVYAERPNVREALLHCLKHGYYLSSSTPPLTEAEMQQAAQFWQEDVTTIPTGLKSLKQAGWNNFCRHYDATDIFLREQIDTHFPEQKNVAEFLKEIYRENTCYSFYLNEDHQTELKEKIAKAVRKYNIGRAEARAIQGFLRTEVQKAPYVSEVLEKATGRFIQLMSEIENITRQIDQLEDLTIRQAIEALIEQLCLAEKPDFQTLAEKYPLNAEQMQQAVDVLEQSTENIPCLDRMISPKKVREAFCGAYSPFYMRRAIESHFSKQTSCKDILFNIFQTIEDLPSDYLESPHFEELVAKQCQECGIGLQEVEALQSFLAGECEKTLFQAQDHKINATTSKLIDHFTAIIERNKATNRFLRSAFEADPSVHHAMELVIDRILVNKDPDESLTPIEKDIPLTNEQKLAVAEFLENEESQLIYQGRSISANEIWRGFCKAYGADSIPMVQFIQAKEGFNGQKVLINAIEDFVQSDEFTKKMSTCLIDEKISSHDAQEIKTVLENYPKVLQTEKLTKIINLLTNYMQIYIERIKLFEAFELEFKLSSFEEDNFVKILLKLLWLPGVETTFEKALQKGYFYSTTVEIVLHFLDKQSAIRSWCGSNCPTLTVPTASVLFKHLSKFKIIKVVFDFKESVKSRFRLDSEKDIQELLVSCSDYITYSDLKDLDQHIDRNPPSKEKAAEIVDFLSRETVKKPFQTTTLSPFYQHLLGKMKKIQNPGLLGWFLGS